MNTQDILARVIDAARPYAVIKAANTSRAYNAESVAHEMHARLSNLAADLAAQVRNEYAASSGRLNAVQAITRMLDAVKKIDTRPALAYAWEDAEGRQCACDGYRAFRLNTENHLPLEPRPENAGEPIHLEKIFPAYAIDNPDMALELPTAQELKAHIALKRAEWTGKRSEFTCNWDFGEGKPAVNASFLLDTLAVMGDGVRAFAVAKTGKMNSLAMLWFTSERGDALLLPVRKDNETGDALNAASAESEADRIQRRRAYNADTVKRLLDDYRVNLERNAEYAMTPDQFAVLACHMEQAAA